MTAKSGDEASKNGAAYTSYETGMCLKWVRGPCWEIGSLYGSAIEAWNGAREKHPGDRNPPVGAPCFYSGGTYGHAVIARPGDRRIRSTDAPSSHKVSDQDLAWPEWAWGYTYLGWTEDLNGVGLPLGAGDTEGIDDVGLQDEITEWSPDEGSTGQTTVGKTLNQARGYSEDTYDRLKKLANRVEDLDDKLDKILSKLS